MKTSSLFSRCNLIRNHRFNFLWPLSTKDVLLVSNRRESFDFLSRHKMAVRQSVFRCLCYSRQFLRQSNRKSIEKPFSLSTEVLRFMHPTKVGMGGRLRNALHLKFWRKFVKHWERIITWNLPFFLSFFLSILWRGESMKKSSSWVASWGIIFSRFERIRVERVNILLSRTEAVSLVLIICTI